MKNKHKKIGLIFACIIGVIVLLILLPLFLDILVFSNDYVSKVSNDGWAGFLGGYIGGIIGGIVTLIAMIVPLSKTQEQIKMAEDRDKLEERKRLTNEIAILVMKYIGDLQIYHDINSSFEEPDKKLFEKYKYYDNLHWIWKNCQKDRCFNGIITYYNELSNKHISSEYPKYFFGQYDIYLGEREFNEYTRALECKKDELQQERQKIKAQIVKARQKYVIGNNTYLLLELKLKDLVEGEDLWEMLSDVYKDSLIHIELYNYFQSKQSFEEKIVKIKYELKVFIEKYLQ